MELQDFQALLVKPDELKKAIEADHQLPVKIEDIKKQYNPKLHEIADPSKRQDKIVNTGNGSSSVSPARIPISMQKRIVRIAATFLCGRPIELLATGADQLETDFVSLVQKTWDDNKLDYKSKELAKLMMTFTECAELWYMEPAEIGFWTGTKNDVASVKYKLRMKILAEKYGDSLYPVFNAAGDMIAFARGFKLSIAGKSVECFDVYTAEKFYYFQKGDNGLAPRMQTAYDGSQKAEEDNKLGKIPVIYYSQDAPEWYDVQELIDRREKLVSNLADTNDYHMSPTLVAKNAKVVDYAQKGEQGKLIEIEGENAELQYVSWDKSPESLKLELETNEKEIYGQTATPNISFEQMKGLGTFSGFAIKMLFVDAHMKASDHEENFGEGIQRRINYIKAAMAFINPAFEKIVNVSIKPKFTYFLPKNEQELVDILTTATTGGIMSKKTAISQNPFVQDPDAEETLIEKEANSAGALDNLMK